MDVEAAVDAVLQDDFGLSDGDMSDEEGEEIYAYLGEPVVSRPAMESLGEELLTVGDDTADGHLGNDDDDPTSLRAESGENECIDTEEDWEMPSRSRNGSSAGETQQVSSVRTRARRQHASRGPAVTCIDHVEGTWSKEEPMSFTREFQKIPGPTNPDEGQSPLQLLGRYFTNSVWEHIVRETNSYAAANKGTTPKARPWTDITVDELKAFVGLLLVMGIVHLPRIEMYWQQSHPLLATVSISNAIPLVRFEQIFRFLHLVDSSSLVPPSQPDGDKLFKIRPLLDMVLPKFESEYELHQFITIDEAMIPFKGRLGFKQYMKAKPTKWGIKVFVLSDSVNGYVYRLQIYTGKHVESSNPSIGLCTRVCLDLLDGLPDNGYCLFTDNYYTGPDLYLTLYNKGINACGTIRTNRRAYPKELIRTNRDKSRTPRGFYDYRSNGPLLACVWFDRRFVNFLSTMHRAEPSDGISTVARRNEDGTSANIPCPPLLDDYVTYMRGVDRGDQMISLYNLGRRSKKWWKRVFYYIIECAILNAYLLERSTLQESGVGRQKRDYLSFRIELAEELIGGFRGRKRSGRQRSEASAELIRLKLELGHFPIQSGKKLECVVCNKLREKRGLTRTQMRHETRIKCNVCDVHLCIDSDRNCYVKYHTLVDYWK